MKRKTIKNFFRTVVAVVSLIGGSYLFRIGENWIYWGSADSPNLTFLIVITIYLISIALLLFGLHMLNLAIFKIHPRRIERKIIKCFIDFNDFLDNLLGNGKK